MAIWVGRCLGTTLLNNIDMETSITSSILAWMGQVRSPSASMQTIDVDGVVSCYNQRPRVEVMEVWSCWGNVKGEPVFNVMVASWFCEKSSWIGKAEDVKHVLLKKTDFNRQPFEEEDFYVDELWNRWISSALIHLGLDIIRCYWWYGGFRIYAKWCM